MEKNIIEITINNMSANADLYRRIAEAMMRQGEGYETALAVAEAQAEAWDGAVKMMSQAWEEYPDWIKVEDRLPEPGIYVLAYFKNDLGKDRIIRAEYSDGHSLPVSDLMDWNGDWANYDEAEDQYYCPVGWFESNEFDEIDYQVDGNITHWMPLPKPPESK